MKMKSSKDMHWYDKLHWKDPDLRDEDQEELDRLESLRDVFYINKGSRSIEIIKNPLGSDYSDLGKEFRREYPHAQRGEPATRFTYDKHGNRYIWRSDHGMHYEIEPHLPFYGRPYSQQKPEVQDECFGLASEVLFFCEKTDQEAVAAASRRHKEREAKERSALRHALNKGVERDKAVRRYRSLPQSNSKYWNFDKKKHDQGELWVPKGHYQWQTKSVADMRRISEEIDRYYADLHFEFTANLTMPHVVTDNPNYDPAKENRINQYKHSVEVIKRMFMLIPRNKKNVKLLYKGIQDWEKKHPSVVAEEEKAGHDSRIDYRKRMEFYVYSDSLKFLFLGFVTWKLPSWAHSRAKYALVLSTVPKDPLNFEPHYSDTELIVEGKTHPLLVV